MMGMEAYLDDVHLPRGYRHYRVVWGQRNWKIETAVWNLASFLHCALEIRWQRCGQFLFFYLHDFLDDILCENLDLLYKNPRVSL